MTSLDKRPYGLFLALLVLGFFLTGKAYAVEKAGDSCFSLGATTISADRTSIVACLLKTAGVVSDPPCKVEGECKWKSMTGGGGVPVGVVVAWPATIDPPDMDNWLECKGQIITKDDYPELYPVIGSKVPDLQGMFLRGYGSQKVTQLNGSTVGMTATTHSSAGLGLVQGDAIRNISGYFAVDNLVIDAGGVFERFQYWDGGESGISGTGGVRFDAARIVPVSTENRPVNVAVRYLIRAKP